MQKINLLEILRKTGLCVYYHHIENPEKVSLPYIIYFKEKCEIYGSDFCNHIEKSSYIFEFYSNIKDFKNENIIKNIFSDYGIAYESMETYIKEEDMYMVAYYIDIIEKI